MDNKTVKYDIVADVLEMVLIQEEMLASSNTVQSAVGIGGCEVNGAIARNAVGNSLAGP